MATMPRIGKGRRIHLYIEEWMKDRGLNDEKIGQRIGVDRATVWRWRTEQHRLNPDKIAILADALQLEDPRDLFRPPSRPSVDAVLRNATDDVNLMALDIVSRLVGRR